METTTIELYGDLTVAKAMYNALDRACGKINDPQLKEQINGSIVVADVFINNLETKIDEIIKKKLESCER